MIECSRNCVKRDLTPADQVHNLKPVARQHRSGNPLRPGKNFKIALDGHAVRGQAEMREQAGHAESRGDFARFSIHYNLDARGHFVDETGILPPRFALSRKRSSPWRAPAVARITSAAPSAIVAGRRNFYVAPAFAPVRGS